VPTRFLVLVGAVVALAAAASTSAVVARSDKAAVIALPSSATIPPSGPLPAGGKSTIDLNVAIGEREGAWIVVTGAKSVSAGVEPGLAGVQAALSWGHYVKFGTRDVPDALIPWDGGDHPTEKPNQPIYLQVNVPAGTNPALYRGTIKVTADGVDMPLTLNVNVANVTLPAPGRQPGSIPTSFHVGGESYVNKVDAVYHLANNAARQAAANSLYKFLADYRISPASWGFGEPQSTQGYQENKVRWWLDSAGNMIREVNAGPGFPAMRIPISNNRTSARNYIAGINPQKPETWCSYLGVVHKFWADNGWLDTGPVVPYVYGVDEPGLEGQQLVAKQSKVVHQCFPGGKTLMTGNPSPTGKNAFLFDGKGGDDLDIFVVLAGRFYGSFTVPKQVKEGNLRERQQYDAIQLARKHGAKIWSYTYAGSGAPGFNTNEPLSDPRMFFLWNALERTDGALYGEGTTTYTAGNPLDSVAQNGEFVLIYPGRDAPIPSARLEQIRDGIEDWEILNIVAQKHGAAAVANLLGGAGLFSAGAGGVKLGCTVGCDLQADTPYAWPSWSHDGTTPERIEALKKAALAAAQ